MQLGRHHRLLRRHRRAVLRLPPRVLQGPAELLGFLHRGGRRLRDHAYHGLVRRFRSHGLPVGVVPSGPRREGCPRLTRDGRVPGVALDDARHGPGREIVDLGRAVVDVDHLLLGHPRRYVHQPAHVGVGESGRMGGAVPALSQGVQLGRPGHGLFDHAADYRRRLGCYEHAGHGSLPEHHVVFRPCGRFYNLGRAQLDLGHHRGASIGSEAHLHGGGSTQEGPRTRGRRARALQTVQADGRGRQRLLDAG
mmetsp:Transcript_93453/g.269119  ORF Transcript_93453/g.269119 Transcript_93453/m.269119 type:complete len:251 (-) Transcript_93453:232-984(-)